MFGYSGEAVNLNERHRELRGLIQVVGEIEFTHSDECAFMLFR